MHCAEHPYIFYRLKSFHLRPPGVSTWLNVDGQKVMMLICLPAVLLPRPDRTVTQQKDYRTREIMTQSAQLSSTALDITMHGSHGSAGSRCARHARC